MEKKPIQLVFKYVCPEDLRDLYVNGLYGGVTPRDEIYIHFYSERHPIPKKATHTLDKKGMVGKVGNMELGGDVVRLIQSSISMDVSTAVAFRDWLNERIDFINKQKKEDGYEAKS